MAPAIAALQPVQEMIQGGGSTVPERYIQQTDDRQVADAALPPMDCPTIDFSLLLSSEEELGKLHYALTSWGGAQVVNHNVASSFLDEVREMSKQFFKLPIEDKEKCSDKGGLEGYGNTNGVQQGSLNWNDKLHLLVHPQGKRQLEFWPNNPENFGKTLDEYTRKVTMMLETLFKAVARSLKLEENRFSDLWQAKEDLIHARFNFYPRCPNSDLVIGLKPHTDGTAITILLQDKEVEALRIKKDDQWFRVPVIPEAVVILLGDQMEIATNGIYKSPIHKVIINPEHDRISVAMLSIPDPEKEIGPMHELITKERPQLYKRLKDYGAIYTQSIPSGERQINLVKINHN